MRSRRDLDGRRQIFCQSFAQTVGRLPPTIFSFASMRNPQFGPKTEKARALTADDTDGRRRHAEENFCILHPCDSRHPRLNFFSVNGAGGQGDELSAGASSDSAKGRPKTITLEASK